MNELIVSKCAGDYPGFSLWPYTPADLNRIINQMDPIRFPDIKKCNVTDNFFIGVDDHTPEVYYADDASTECTANFYLLESTKNYKCDKTVKYEGARFCPCCKPGK